MFRLRNGSSWSVVEEDLAYQYLIVGMTVGEVARLLMRTSGAIASRLAKRGLLIYEYKHGARFYIVVRR